MADEQVRIVRSDGSTGHVPKANLRAALADGWHIETPEESAQRTGGGMVAALAQGAAAGAIEGATAPVRLANRAVEAVTGINLGDKAAQAIDRATGGTGVGQTFEGATSGRNVLESTAALGGGLLTDKSVEQSGREAGESMRATALANPTASAVGNIGGQLGALALTGGAGLLTKGGQLAQAATAARLGTVGSKAVVLGLTGAGEGILQGAAQANEDAYIENVPATAERFWANVGMNAAAGGILGGVGGGVLGKLEARSAAKAALGAGRNAEAEALQEVARGALGVEPAPGLGKAIREVSDAATSGRVGRAYEGTASTLSGVPREAVEKYGPHKIAMGDAEALSGMDKILRRDEIVHGATGEITDAVRSMRGDSSEVFSEIFEAPLKRENVVRLMANADKQAALAGAREQAATIRSKLGALDDLETFGDNKWAKGARKYIDDALDDVMSGALGAEDSYMALDATKRQLQRLGKKAEGGAAGQTMDLGKRDQLQLFADLTKEAAEDVRFHLEDASLFDRQGTAQAKYNAATKRWLDSKEMADRSLMTRTGDDYGRARWEVDPGKVEQFVGGLGTRRAELAERYIKENIDAERNLVDEIANNLDLGTKHQAKIEGVRQAHAKIVKALEQADSTVKLANQGKAWMEAENAGAASLLGPILGAVPGVSLATKPMQAAMQAARIRALAGNTVKRTSKALEGFFGHIPHSAVGKAAGSAVKALPSAGRRAAVASVTGGGASPAMAEAPKHRERVAELAANPVAMAAEVDRFLGDSARHLPQTRMALAAVPMRAIQFLASKLPPAPPPNALDGAYKAPISKASQDRFNEYVAGATDPLSALDELQRGMLTPQRIEAVQAVYPELYNDIRTAVFDYVVAASEAKTPLKYQKRIQLDLLFGGGGAIEPSAKPAHMRVVEQAAMAQKQAPQRPQKPGGAPNVAQHHQSLLDKINL